MNKLVYTMRRKGYKRKEKKWKESVRQGGGGEKDITERRQNRQGRSIDCVNKTN